MHSTVVWNNYIFLLKKWSINIVLSWYLCEMFLLAYISFVTDSTYLVQVLVSISNSWVLYLLQHLVTSKKQFHRFYQFQTQRIILDRYWMGRQERIITAFHHLNWTGNSSIRDQGFCINQRKENVVGAKIKVLSEAIDSQWIHRFIR